MYSELILNQNRPDGLICEIWRSCDLCNIWSKLEVTVLGLSWV